MPSRLSGKAWIITGTGGSVGREVARTLARENALVVGCDLTVDTDIVVDGGMKVW
jgi:NAD(P)-dependent dehydrogenase (short-subunit alcohol dehydrogenase family)